MLIGTLYNKKGNEYNGERLLAIHNYVNKYITEGTLDADIKSESMNICKVNRYAGRETVIDYLGRNRRNIVIQDGGFTHSYFPYLGLTAYLMLFESEKFF